MVSQRIGLFTRVAVGMAVVGVIFVGFGTISLSRLRQLDRDAGEIDRRSVQAADLLTDAELAALEARRLVLRHVVADDRSEKQRIEEDLYRLDQEIVTAIRAFVASDVDADAMAATTRAEQAWLQYAEQRNRAILPLSYDEADTTAVLAALDANRGNADEAIGALGEANRLSDEDAAALVARLGATYASARTLLLALLGSGVVVLVLVAAMVVRSVQGAARRVRQVAAALADSASGLDRTSTTLAGAAEETCAQSESVAVGADQVRSGVERVAVATEQLSGSLGQISANTSRASTVTSEASSLASSSASLMTRLSASSDQISTVLELITDIAAQTNLLALNATIEAARAGDTGRGFAVVADEVKALAEAAADSSREIGERVQAIQTDAIGAIDAINRITVVISEVDALQREVADAVVEQAATTAEISRTIDETARSSAEIAGAVAAVAEAARTSTTDAQATNGAARALATLAADLEGHVRQFRY